MKQKKQKFKPPYFSLKPTSEFFHRSPSRSLLCSLVDCFPAASQILPCFSFAKNMMASFTHAHKKQTPKQFGVLFLSDAVLKKKSVASGRLWLLWDPAR